jgi:hypothetical protein
VIYRETIQGTAVVGLITRIGHQHACSSIAILVNVEQKQNTAGSANQLHPKHAKHPTTHCWEQAQQHMCGYPQHGATSSKLHAGSWHSGALQDRCGGPPARCMHRATYVGNQRVTKSSAALYKSTALTLSCCDPQKENSRHRCCCTCWVHWTQHAWSSNTILMPVAAKRRQY